MMSYCVDVITPWMFGPSIRRQGNICHVFFSGTASMERGTLELIGLSPQYNVCLFQGVTS
jgi:hypothetical protein